MRHVLVIEDEYLTAQCVADVVMYAGASSVDIVSDEAAALEAATSHCPTVIISDVDLKAGGRGPEAVKRIHALHGAVPVIFVTGDPEDGQACALGTTILTKPITAQRLASTIQTVTGDIPRWREHAAMRPARSDQAVSDPSAGVWAEGRAARPPGGKQGVDTSRCRSSASALSRQTVT